MAFDEDWNEVNNIDTDSNCHGMTALVLNTDFISNTKRVLITVKKLLIFEAIQFIYPS